MSPGQPGPSDDAPPGTTWSGPDAPTAEPATVVPATDPDPVVELIDLDREFPAQLPGAEPVRALRGVSLRIERGEYVSIIGQSGSGKSTLLHLLGLLDRPTRGRYLLDGQDVSTWGDRRRSGLRGGRIGFVFQSFHLLPRRSVLDNVTMSMLYQGVPRSERRDRAREALAQVGLSHREEFLPPLLSGGERQRVAVARALAGRPTLLLADEPTGNLDHANAMAVMDLFDQLHDQGLTLAVITHDEQVSARAQRRIRLQDGQVVSG